jgi:hypothetical protein
MPRFSKYRACSLENLALGAAALAFVACSLIVHLYCKILAFFIGAVWEGASAAEPSARLGAAA